MTTAKEESMCVVKHPIVRRGNALSQRTRWADRDSGSRRSCGIAGRGGHKALVVLQGVLALSLLSACASSPPRVLSSIAPSYATLPNGYEPLNPTQPSPIYAAVTAVPGDNL